MELIGKFMYTIETNDKACIKKIYRRNNLENKIHAVYLKVNEWWKVNESENQETL